MNTKAGIKEVLFVLIAVVFIGAIFGRAIQSNIKQETIPPNGVVEKFERDGKCYLKVVLEVTPDEYITYDVGDEYGRMK